MIRNRREELKALPVERCCQLLKVCRSEYYSRRLPVATPEPGFDALVQAAADNRPVCGYRGLSERMKKAGHKEASHKRVRSAMKRLGLTRRPKHRTVRTTTPGTGPVALNLAKEMKLTGPRQLLVTDFTYVALPKKFGYVSVILDAFSRRALGWAVSEHIDTELAKTSLSAVFANHALKEGWVHHSDRGSQYTSSDYRELVQSGKGVLSNSRKGNPYDNAKMESFFKTYKCEEVYRAEYDSLDDLRYALEVFINDYNHERLHSSLGYLSPIEFEQIHERQNNCVSGK